MGRSADAGERSYVQSLGRRYWPRNEGVLAALPVPHASGFAGRLVDVPLPGWAGDLGVGRRPALLVDAACLLPGDQPAYARCDWWSAAFHFLTGTAEQRHEAVHGPAHSYAFRLRGVDGRQFDRAWVNRILLLLRRWAARLHERDENRLFGARPTAAFDLTHDVDAVDKTVALRLKQPAFHLFNAARLTARGEWASAARRLRTAARFLVSSGDYWCFPAVRSLEERCGVRSTFHFAATAGRGRRSLRRWLLDPGYDASSPRLVAEMRSLVAGGWRVGLHQGFDTWRDSRRMAEERRVIEHAVGVPVVRCRQHWLRFSWSQTWRAQSDTGLRLDTTLGFNDRPGFRNGAALRFRPWDPETRAPLAIEALPTLLMDSHLYDYRPTRDQDRLAVMARWVDEVKAVGGEVSVLWHQHVMHADYGWAPGYVELLSLVAG